MKSFARVLVFTVLAVGAAAVPSPASPVYYTVIGSMNPVFSGPDWNLGPVHEESFQFVVPDFITSHLVLATEDVDVCVGCAPTGPTMEFFPDAAFGFGRDQISFVDGIGVIFGFFFEPGAFGAVGTYATNGDAYGSIGTLTVSLERPDFPPTLPPVPEPSIAMLTLGGLVAAYQRHRMRLS